MGNDKTKGSERSKDWKKNKKKGSTKRVSRDVEPVVDNNINDASWYYTDSTTMALFSDVAIQGINGIALQLDEIKSTVMPTICIGMLNPAVTPSIDKEMGHISGINQVATKWFQTLSSQNAKTTQYQPNDILMAILSVGEILSMSSYMRRAFNMAFSYNTRNRMFPKNALYASGIDAEDFIANYPEYEQRFNQLMILANQIAIPAQIPYFAKCATLYDNVYVDDRESSLSQVMFNIPYSTWIIDEIGYDTGTVLTTEILMSNDYQVFGNYITTLETMINHMLNSTTLNYIYSDILNLSIKQGVQLLSFGTLEVTDLPIIYSEEFNLQFHNSRAINAPMSTPAEGYTSKNDVHSDPDTGLIWYNPQFSWTNQFLDHFTILDFVNALPTTEERCNATRYLALGISNLEGGSYKSEEITFGDHYYVAYKLYDIDKDHVNSFGHANMLGYTDANKLKIAARMSKFDWAPLLPLVEDGNKYEFVGDINNYTTVTFEYLKRINEFIPLSLYALRQ